MKWYLFALKIHINFIGRARRTEYWMLTLFNILFAFVALILDNVLGIPVRDVGFGPIYGLYALFTFLPALAVSIRRLHDVDKSGWMLFITLIPLIRSIWFLILMVSKGIPEENEYDVDPVHF